MARSHFLEVPENPLEIPNHGTCNSPVQSFCGKASDQVERPKECALVSGCGTHWYLVL